MKDDTPLDNEASGRPNTDASPEQRIEHILGSLTEREKRDLCLRFGISGPFPRNLNELGELFGVSREQVRQVEAKALDKLRHPSRRRNTTG